MSNRYVRLVLVLVLVLATVSALPARAQSASPAAIVMSASRLIAIGDSLSPAASRTAQLGRGPGYTYGLTHRDSSGGLEVHADWTDIFVIEAGTATILTGGALEGARESSRGEWRGGVLTGGTRAAVKTGDIVVIPAGTPHQMLLADGERVSYIAFKVAKPAPAP